MKSKSIECVSYHSQISSLGFIPKPGEVNVYIHNLVPAPSLTHLPHRSDRHIVALITGGNTHLKLNNTDHYLRKFDLVYMAPSTIRTIVSLDNDSSGMTFSFTDDLLFSRVELPHNSFAFELLAPNTCYHFSLPEDEATMLVEALQLFYKKEALNRGHYFSKEIMLHDFNSLLFQVAGLYQRYHSGIKSQVSRKDEIFKRFIRLLNVHFKKERGLKFYADQMFLTTNYLSKIVKEMLGKTAGDLIDEMVILEAKVLLQNATLSIAEIADQLFFSDPFIFSKFFKKHTGYPPSLFRKSLALYTP